MAYEDPKLKRTHRHTVRFRLEDDQLLSVLANRLGVQKATLIQNMALMAAENELAKLSQFAGCGGQGSTSTTARC